MHLGIIYPDPVSFVSTFSELLYYAPRDFCILVGAMAQRKPDAAPDIAAMLVELLGQSPFAEMAISRIWVAYLFTSQALPIDHQLLQRLNLQGSNSVIERRQNLLLRGVLNDRAYFREWKTRFDEASDWEKPALMYGASCLSKGEFNTWLDTIKDHVNDPFSDIYRKWLSQNQKELMNKLKVRFYVKSKSERIFEHMIEEGNDDLPP